MLHTSISKVAFEERTMLVRDAQLVNNVGNIGNKIISSTFLHNQFKKVIQILLNSLSHKNQLLSKKNSLPLSQYSKPKSRKPSTKQNKKGISRFLKSFRPPHRKLEEYSNDNLNAEKKVEQVLS